MPDEKESFFSKQKNSVVFQFECMEDRAWFHFSAESHYSGGGGRSYWQMAVRKLVQGPLDQVPVGNSCWGAPERLKADTQPPYKEGKGRELGGILSLVWFTSDQSLHQLNTLFGSQEKDLGFLTSCTHAKRK